MHEIDISEYNDTIAPKFLSLQDVAACDGKYVAVDTETTGLQWFNDDVIGVSLFCPEAKVWGYYPTLDSTDAKNISTIIRGWYPKTSVIMHNAKFDLHFLGINPNKARWKLIDTTDLIHLYDSRIKKAMKSAEEIFLGTSSKRQFLETPQRTKIWNWDMDILYRYASNDVLVTFQLAQYLIPEIKKLGLTRLFWKDMKFLGVLWEAERRGIKVDFDFVEMSVEVLLIDEKRMEQELWDACGKEFNWRSPWQLSDAIYKGLGIAKPKNPFADADGIDRSKLADKGLYKSCCTSTFLLTEKVHHPLGELIAELRESFKMRRYIEKYAELTDSNGRVHPNFNLTGTRTGRLSCSKPNMQNVPSMHRGRFTQKMYSGRHEVAEAYNLRKAFIPSDGMEFLSIDYKQMEMRMFGILSKDPFMLNALNEGLDIHAEIAERVWGVRDKVHREWSKTIGFGLIYGMTIGSLMFKLNMTKREAAVVRDQYLREFPRIMPWMDEVIRTCRAMNYVRYWSSRLWREDNPMYMYKGANALIQGGCADFLSVIGIRCQKYIESLRSPPKTEINILSFIHDEIMFEVEKGSSKHHAEKLTPIMEGEDIFKIPFMTDAKGGMSYGSYEPLDEEVEQLVYLEGVDV